MKIKNVCHILFVTLTVGLAVSTRATDVSRYFLVKGQDYFQTNATTVLSLTNQKPFRFTTSVDGTATDSVRSASIKLPNLQTRTLTNTVDGVAEYETGFTNKPSLDTAYGAGSYIYTIVGKNDGTNKPVLALPLDNYPTVPKISRWDDLQAVEALQPLNISWGAFTNGTTNDLILVDISAADGTTVATTPALLTPGMLNGTNVGAQIPAGVLADGSTYAGRLLFVKRTSLSTDYPGAKGLAGYFRETKFPVVTLPTPPSSGRIQFSAGKFSAAENSGAAGITITRSGSVGSVSVDFATQNGTAHDGIDYQGVSQTVNFADGETVKVFPVTLLNNYLLDGNRTVNLWLTSPQGGAELGNRTNSVLTIIDDEIAAAGKLQFATRSNSVPEAGRFVTLTVNRIGGSTGGVSVNYSTADGTALAGQNYVATNGTLVFGSGILSKTITVPIINDSLFESNEVFSVNLTSTTGGAALGTNTMTKVGIVNDDFGGTFAFKQSSYATNEFNTNFVVTVVRTGGTANGVTVDYATHDGTALDGVRYVGTSGTLSFGSNELSKTFLIGVINDNLPNGNQNFTAQLSNPTGGAKIGTNAAANTATFTVLDDESSLAFSNATYTVSEGVGALTLTVVRTGPKVTPAGVSFATVNGSATAGIDFRATNGILVFPANTAAKTFSISITNNTIVDADRTFTVELSSATGALLGAQSIALVTITNNDFGGAISFGSTNYSVSEGGTNAVITLVRSGGLASGVSVDFGTTDGTGADGINYSNATQTVTFNAGETNKKVLVPIINDALVEGTRTVLLSLGNFQNTSPGARTSATLSIADNDLGGVLNLSRTNLSAFENATNFFVSVIRSGGKAAGVSVDYATQDGTALDGVRYVGTSGTLTFGANETNKIISIPIINDTTPNGNQSFRLQLANAQGGATLGAATNATLTVLDDESSISLGAAAVTVSEAGSSVVVTLTRTGVSNTVVSVDYATSDGSATAGVDYRATNGTVTFPANTTVKTITLPIIDNTIVDFIPARNFTFRISNPTGGVQVGGTDTETITITNNDVAGAIQFASANITGFQGSNAVVKITRTGGSASGASVLLVMGSGTAVNGTDYIKNNQTVTFNAGETNKTILITLPFNALNTTSRTLGLVLSAIGGNSATLGSPIAALLTIQHKADANAVPITGPIFMSANFGSAAVNITPKLTDTVNGSLGTAFQLQVTWASGSIINLFIVSGLHFATGTSALDNNGTFGIMDYSKTGLTSQQWDVANGSASVGSFGTFIIDAIDTTTKRVSGRFTFHAIAGSGTTPATLDITNGKFRTTYN